MSQQHFGNATFKTIQKLVCTYALFTDRLRSLSTNWGFNNTKQSRSRTSLRETQPTPRSRPQQQTSQLFCEHLERKPLSVEPSTRQHEEHRLGLSASERHSKPVSAAEELSTAEAL